MTDAFAYKIAKWLKKHGDTKRKNIPTRFPHDLYGDYKYFHVYHTSTDAEGYPVISEDNVYAMSDTNIDAYVEERRRRIHEFRDWLEPTGVIVANIIAIIALIVSIIALSAQ